VANFFKVSSQLDYFTSVNFEVNFQ